MNTSFDHKDTPKNQRHSQHESQSAKTHPSRTIVHAKLEMTDPGDHDEQEADAMADAVVSGGKISRKISGGGGGSSGIAVSQQMESQLSQLQGGGRPMPQGLLNMMESGFGQDFGHVRIHTDVEAADMSSSISAKAFTLGNDIYFNRGQFNPETTEGQRLVAHELTHVVQGTGKVGRYFLDSQFDRYNEAALEAVHDFDRYFSLDFETAIAITNLIADILSTINNIAAFKDMYAFKNMLKTIQKVVDTESNVTRSMKSLAVEHMSNTPPPIGKTATKYLGWAGIVLALQDMWSTFKSVDFVKNPKTSIAVIVLKTSNLSAVIISQPAIFSKVLIANPTIAALIFAFGAGYAIGDSINILSEMLFGKAPGTALVDYVMKNDYNKVTKDDVINYPKYASSRVYTELCLEYNRMEEDKKKNIIIVGSSKTGRNTLFDKFMIAYQGRSKKNTEGNFLRGCFMFPITTSFTFQLQKKGKVTDYRLQKDDCIILRQAFCNVGLYP